MLIAAMVMLSGVVVLFGGPRPGSVNASLPTPLLLLWAGVCAVGGALVVAAAVVPPLAALLLELSADPPLAVMCVVYAASALMLAGWKAAVPVAIVAGIAVAFAVRTVQVARSLRVLRKEMARREEIGP